MTFLNQSEMEKALSTTKYSKILLLSPVRRHLFYLGGVPRFFVKYSCEVGSLPDLIPEFSKLEHKFNIVWNEYVSCGFPDLTSDQILLLIAYSLSGIPVNETDAPFKDKRTWKRLRDTSMCLIGEDSKVIVPYSTLKYASNNDPHLLPSLVQQNMVHCLKWLSDRVDKVMFDSPPWNLWEKFGACFHALRINSLCLIGYKSIPFKQLCSGALVNGCDEEVDLQPVLVFESGEKYSTDLIESIPEYQYPQRQVNWLKGDGKQGFVVLNQSGGDGIDIFFSMKMTKKNGFVICVDQRKREAASLGITKAEKYLTKEDIFPDFLKRDDNLKDSVLCRGLFSSFSSYGQGQTTKKQQNQQLPDNSFIVTYSNTKKYHNSLAFHPAASPCVNVNYDPISYIKLITTTDKAADAILLRRLHQKFVDMAEFEKFMEAGQHTIKFKERITF